MAIFPGLDGRIWRFERGQGSLPTASAAAEAFPLRLSLVPKQYLWHGHIRFCAGWLTAFLETRPVIRPVAGGNVQPQPKHVLHRADGWRHGAALDNA